MRVRTFVTLAALAATSPALAADTGSFVIRLGQDTTAVETFTRSPERLEVLQVGRTPRVLERRFVYEYQGGTLHRFTMTVKAAGADTTIQSLESVFGPDSVRTTVTGAQTQRGSVALPAGTMAIASTSPWVIYEDAVMKLVQGKRDSVSATAWFIGTGGSPNPISIRRAGRDSVVIDNLNQRNDRFRARVDAKGRLLGVRPVAGTLQLGAERVERLDLAALAASFAARERAGGGIGILSQRDTVTATAGGASLWVDYSRPSKRGRDIFGALVPYGQVWRTGANAATQFKTDKALAFGEVVVPAGFYTLFSIPGPQGWTLLVNGETGQAGTAHKPEKDLFRIPLTVTALPEVVERFTIGVEPADKGGVLRFEWDRTRAAASFTVRE
jgi:hypothetical protein